MGIEEDISKLILIEKKNILHEIDELKKKLGIFEKISSMVDFIDDLDSIHLRNLDLEANKKDIAEQLQSNKDKKLELWCYIKGKKTYIKSFGTISNVDSDTLTIIYKLTTILKLIKKVNESSYYASKYHHSESMFGTLNVNDN